MTNTLASLARFSRARQRHPAGPEISNKYLDFRYIISDVLIMAGVCKQLPLSFGPPQITPQGDGSYVVRAGKPIHEMNVQQAIAFLGIGKTRMYDLLNAGLIPHRRPLPHKILIPTEALEKYREDTRDPEYWDRLDDEQRGQLALLPRN